MLVFRLRIGWCYFFFGGGGVGGSRFVSRSHVIVCRSQLQTVTNQLKLVSRQYSQVTNQLKLIAYHLFMVTRLVLLVRINVYRSQIQENLSYAIGLV